MVTRKREVELLKWKDSPIRKPLLLRGARQVGKSYLIESFGKTYFDNCITVNFEKSKEYLDCFETLKPENICKAIALLSSQKIIPGKTLLFLDEIQDCPNAIRALRYFKENMPELHVIGAGSLLELKLNEADYRMPVGRVSFMFLHPLSFTEFLTAFDPGAADYFSEASIKTPYPLAIHEHFLRALRVYFVQGGMPAVLAAHLNGADINDLLEVQANILNTYRNDLGHYDSEADLSLLKHCFEVLPRCVSEQIKYSKLAPEVRSKDLKRALSVLEQVNIINSVVATTAQGLPLARTQNEKKFKYCFLDVGLVKRMNQLDASVLLNQDLMLLDQGVLAEQFVGQELLAHSDYYEKHQLYFWSRDEQGGRAEIDFLTVIDGQIFPIEVKSGATGRLRSLHQYLLEHDCPFGIRISMAPLSFEEKSGSKILSVPLYLISELPRLVKEVRETL